MKKIRALIKDRIVTGIAVIVPIVVVGVILKDVVKKVIKFTDPLTDMMAIENPLLRTTIASIVLIAGLAVLFFILGSFFKTYLGRTFDAWLEEKILGNIPFFKTISAVTRQITGIEKSQYAIVEVDLYGNNNRIIGLLTETLSDGRCMIYIPFAPVVNIGQVIIVAKENIEYLDVHLKDATDIISKIGFEADKVYKKRKQN